LMEIIMNIILNNLKKIGKNTVNRIVKKK